MTYCCRAAVAKKLLVETKPIVEILSEFAALESPSPNLFGAR
jgi:hypothetical protein